jgi:hypothetical protein
MLIYAAVCACLLVSYLYSEELLWHVSNVYWHVACLTSAAFYQ